MAERVYDFLKSNGLSVFIASEELGKIGEAQYADAIDEVLDNSNHMVVVASSVENVKSKWVKYEWGTFSNDLKSGYRSGNLLTVLCNSISLKSLPASLRHQQSFTFESYKDEILSYLGVSRKEAKPNADQQPESNDSSIAVFKFYANENCQVFLDGSPIADLVGMNDDPFCFNVSKKGDYRFRCVNQVTGETIILRQHIDAYESKEVEVTWKGRVSGEVLTVDVKGLSFEMIRVEGGSLTIGATQEQELYAQPDEFPAHEISLPTFYIGKFPVTQNLWETVMGYNKSYFGPEARLARLKSVNAPKSDFDNDKKNGGFYPAESLTYDEAQEFVRRLFDLTKLKFDLPTEEEWEYAARGGQMSRNCRFAGSDILNEVAWHKGNADGSTHPVGQKLPNELGIYDMCGNVWEWTKTPAHTNPDSNESRGNVYIRRGGSWWHEGEDCRVSSRFPSKNTKNTSVLGLRVVIREDIKCGA